MNFTNMNFCFVILLVLGLTQSNLIKKSTIEKAKIEVLTCWRYATNHDDDLKGMLLLNLAYVNKQNGIRKNLIYSNNQEICDNICLKSRFGSTCYGTRPYDLDFKIPKNSYVCWLDIACPSYQSDETLYSIQDVDISHKSKKTCGYLCDAIYGQEGKCMVKKQTEAEKKRNYRDEKYYCFYMKTASHVVAFAK